MFGHLWLFIKVKVRLENFGEGGKLYFVRVCVCGGVRARNV